MSSDADAEAEEWALLETHYKIARGVLLDTIKIVGKKHVVAVADTSERCHDDIYPCKHYGEAYIVYDNGNVHLLKDCDSVTIGVLADYFTPQAHKRDHHFIGYADYFSYDGIPPYEWVDRVPGAMIAIINEAQSIIGKAQAVLEGHGVPKNRRKMKDKQKKKKRARSRSRERSVDIPVASDDSSDESS